MSRLIHHPLRRFLLVLLALAAGALMFVALFLLFERPDKPRTTEYGVTFSRPYARDELKLDPDAVLQAALEDLKIRRFRLPAYWSELEPSKGRWKFEDLDRDITSIQKHGGTVVLAVGEKLPRWPECWHPSWIKPLNRDAQRQEALRYLETVVRHYRDNPAIIAWQVENEPLFDFGNCPAPDFKFHNQEIALVRSLDAERPITSTDSGELSLWVGMSDNLDALGVSVYRVVLHRTFGVLRWYILPEMYASKALLVKPFGLKRTYVSEFQMEPWSTKPLAQTPLEEQFRTMSFEQFKRNLADASRLNLSPIDLWGVEWWYWLKTTKGRPEFWNAAREFFFQVMSSSRRAYRQAGKRGSVIRPVAQ